MMFAKPEDVESDLVGEFDLLDEMAHPLLAFPAAPGGRLGMNVSECV
jgi:hypothetical protein